MRKIIILLLLLVLFTTISYAQPSQAALERNDLGTSEFPILGTALISGDIAFRQHAGGHTTGPNWSTWIAWACRYWKNGD